MPSYPPEKLQQLADSVAAAMPKLAPDPSGRDRSYRRAQASVVAARKSPVVPVEPSR